MKWKMIKTEQFRLHVLFEFNGYVKTTEVAREIFAAYGEGVMKVLPAVGFREFSK